MKGTKDKNVENQMMQAEKVNIPLTQNIQLEDDSVHCLPVMICEDDPCHMEQLFQAVGQIELGVPVCIDTYESADELLRALQEKKNLLDGKPESDFPNVIFTDIRMPGLDGITFGKKVHALFPDTYLIFTTAYEEYAVRGYEARAFRYLLKPITTEVVEEVLQGILREQGKRKKLLIKSLEGERILSLQDLVYLCAEDKYTILYTREEYFVDRTSLQEYETLLAPYGFFRIHRKYIVNICHHRSMRKGKVILSSGEELPLSRRREAAYRARLLRSIDEDMESV